MYLSPKVKDVTDLNTPALAPAASSHLIPTRGVMLFVGRRVVGGHFLKKSRKILWLVVTESIGAIG